MDPPSHARSRCGRRLTPDAYAGFADIVEKVNPAVISVRGKVEGGQEMMGVEDENGSDDALGSAEGFFRRFGKPGGMIPDRTRGERFPLGQGSGFFISAGWLRCPLKARSRSGILSAS